MIEHALHTGHQSTTEAQALGVREGAQWFKPLIALAEDPGLIPSTPQWLATVCNSSLIPSTPTVVSHCL